MRRGDVVSEQSGGSLGVVPVVSPERVGQFLAVKADLPGKQAVRIERSPPVISRPPRYRRGEAPRTETPVVIELDESLGLLGRRRAPRTAADRSHAASRTTDSPGRTAAFHPAACRRPCPRSCAPHFRPSQTKKAAPETESPAEARAPREVSAASIGAQTGASAGTSLRGRLQVCGRELAVLAAVEIIDDQADHQPDEKANPVHDRQPGHQQQAREDRHDGRKQTAGRAESAAADPARDNAKSARRRPPARKQKASRYSKDPRACRCRAARPECRPRIPRPRWKNPACGSADGPG